MNDTRRIAAIACFLLVTLRLMIGWQLFYEGFWKIRTLSTPTPWTAAGYLRNAQGPLRDHFRQLAGDPDDLGLIEAKKIKEDEENPERIRYWVPGVEPKWDAWQKRFTKHYSLNKSQAGTLNRWLNGAKSFEVDLAEMPIDPPGMSKNKNLSYIAEKKRLAYKGHMLPDARNKLEKAVDADLDGIPDIADATPQGKPVKPIDREDAVVDSDEDGVIDEFDADATGGKDENKNKIDDASEADKLAQYLTALQALFKRSKEGMSFKAKLRATVAGNPEWVEDDKAQRMGEIKKYKTMLAEYESDLAEATEATSLFPFPNKSFRFDHLQHSWGKIQAKRSELVGPVKALDKELKDRAMKLLSVEQLKRGPVPEAWTQLRISDMMTIAGLTILGAMLILGFWTRFAAVMAAVMLFMFYAAMPPWPGVPEIPGPEHSFIVNKNFIEVVALLAIAALPTGRWFGVDGMIGRILARRRAAKKANFDSKWEKKD